MSVEQNEALIRRFDDEVFAEWNLGAIDEIVGRFPFPAKVAASHRSRLILELLSVVVVTARESTRDALPVL